MDAIKILIADHRVLQQLMKKVEATSERGVKTREDLFAKIKHEATIHEKAEEKYLYPALLNSKKNRPDALEHREEVSIMSRLLKELSKIDASSEGWTAKFTVLKELTDHHIEEEEEEFFPAIRRVLTPEELDAVGDQILAYKKLNKS